MGVGFMQIRSSENARRNGVSVLKLKHAMFDISRESKGLEKWYDEFSRLISRRCARRDRRPGSAERGLDLNCGRAEVCGGTTRKAEDRERRKV